MNVGNGILQMAGAGELTNDLEWDHFLISQSRGHFQQSAMWSQVKSADGWHVYRVILRENGQIAGGFQMLFKKKGLFRIGYISKGPVSCADSEKKDEQIAQSLCRAARDLKLQALIVQPPDLSALSLSNSKQNTFLPEKCMNVIEATLVVDLRSGIENVERNLRRTTRREIRIARKCGVSVFEAQRKDIPVFFSLMQQSCKRQMEKRPNPSSVHAVQAVWDAFKPGGNVRLTLAQSNNHIVAGLLCLSFGQLLSIWKKGSLHKDHAGHAMDLLYYDALQWGCQNKLAYADFCALRPDIAMDMIHGNPLSKEQMESRHYFNIGFGGKALLLPPPLIYFTNPALKMLYRGATSLEPLSRLFKRWLG